MNPIFFQIGMWSLMVVMILVSIIAINAEGQQDHGLTRDYLYMLNNGTSFTCKETLDGQFIGCFKNEIIRK